VHDNKKIKAITGCSLPRKEAIVTAHKPRKNAGSLH